MSFEIRLTHKKLVAKWARYVRAGTRLRASTQTISV